MKTSLTLKPITLKDIDSVMTWVNDPEVVRNFQHFGKKFSRADELKFMGQLIKSKINIAFSIFRKSDGAYIGQCAVNQIAWENKIGRLALVIVRNEWNKGYAQQILPLLVKHAFAKLKLHKVWLMCYASNAKALHIYKKLGFKQEGVLRKEYLWRGQYHNMVRMAMLKEEFTRS